MTRSSRPWRDERRVLLGGAAVIVIALVAMLLTVDGLPVDAIEGPRLEDSSAQAEVSIIRGPEASKPTPLHQDGRVVPGEPASGVTGRGTRDPGPADEAAIFRGRVVDEEGIGVMGARVWYRPSAEAQAALGFDPYRHLYADVPAADRVHADTGPEGHFVLRAPPLPDPRPQRCFFAVTSAAHARRSLGFNCFANGPWDLGVIVVHPGGSCSGRVVDESGLPLPDIHVHAWTSRWQQPELYDEDPIQPIHDALFWVQTDLDGRFTISGLAAGMARVRARAAAGWAPHESDDFAVEAGKNVDLGDLVLQRGDVLSGVVVAGDGTPIASAEVLATTWRVERFFFGELPQDTILFELGYVQGRSQTPRGRTAADGSFHVKGLEKTAVRVYVSAPGYEPARVKDVASDRTDLVVVLVPEARAELLVVDRQSGEPLPNARIEAKRLSGASYNDSHYPLQVLPGDEPGAFVVAGIGPAGTRLLAFAAGFAPAVTLLDAPGRPVRIALEPEAVITGRVVDGKGTPIPAASVRIAPAGDLEGMFGQRETATDALGRYRLGALCAGEWTLGAEAPGHVPAGALPVVLAGAQKLEWPDLALRSAGVIAGRVFQADGAACPGGVRVAAIRCDTPSEADSPSADTDTRTDSDGHYTLDGLAAGTWELSTEAGGLARTVVKPDAVVQADIYQRRRPILAGRVTAGGLPLASASVQSRRRTERAGRVRWRHSANARTGSDGGYRLVLDEPAEFRLSVGSLQGAEIDLTAGFIDWGQEVTVDVHFGSLSLSGVVVDRHSQLPVSDAWIHVDEADDICSAWVYTDNQGRFAVGHLLTGRYTVEAGDDGHFPASIGPLSLSDDGTVEDLRFELDRGAVIAGTVVGPRGTAVQDGTWVGLQRTGEERLDESTETEGGRFRFAALRPGKIRIVVMADANRWTESLAFEQHVVVEQVVTLGQAEELEVRLVVPEDSASR